MHISWLGQTAIKLQVKPSDKDVTILIDPYKPSAGSFPRNLLAHLGLYTHGEKGSITLSGEPFIINEPGECETQGILVTAVPSQKQEELLLRLDAEQISLAHLGLINKPLNNEQIDALSGVDILFVPVGNNNCYDAEAAAKAVNAIEPRIVIPMAYKCDTDPKAKPVNIFLKEMGISNGKAEKKVIIKKKDLPQEETKVIVLAKE